MFKSVVVLYFREYFDANIRTIVINIVHMAIKNIINPNKPNFNSPVSNNSNK